LKAAQELLSAKGLEGFKLADVAARAGANVALVSYYFGGKDELLDEVIRQTGVQVAQARTMRLEALLADSGGEPPSIEAIVRCWLEPWYEQVQRAKAREAMMLMVHLMFATDVGQERKERLLEDTIPVTNRFLDVLEERLPGEPRASLAMRMLCAVGASYLVLGQRTHVGLSRLAGGRGQFIAAPSFAFEKLLAFVVAGLTAPAMDGEPSIRTKTRSAGTRAVRRR
jgi:AcrR family transcriptional regulator